MGSPVFNGGSKKLDEAMARLLRETEVALLETCRSHNVHEGGGQFR